MKEVNKLILASASLQSAILANANAWDDDLESTWLYLKDDYEAFKSMMDAYIKSKESDHD
jgi:hypothetical protein